jgi:hypothetical protein
MEIHLSKVAGSAIMRNHDDSFQRLFETKQKLQHEEEPVVVKLLKKHEKRFII